MILGIGTDIIEIDRIKDSIEKWDERFIKRILTTEEMELMKTRSNSSEFLAGRFAAKEAIYKAVNDPSWTWQDISILTGKEGQPECKILKDGYNNAILISISHSKNHAIANAIVTQKF